MSILSRPVSKVRTGLSNPRTAARWLHAYSRGALAKHQHESQLELLRGLQDDDDWLLVILDACRYGEFDDLFGAYFTGTIRPVAATGLNTFRYVGAAWPDEYDLPYVTAAAPITTTEFDFQDDDVSTEGVAFEGDVLERKYDGYVPANHLSNVHEVWREHWDEELRVCPPEPVTDRAIELAENDAPDRLVAHYAQPHAPFIGEEKELDDREELDEKLRGGPIDGRIWDRVRGGEITQKRLHTLYVENLKRGMGEAALLVDSVDVDRIVVTSDHGEALGEFGLYGHGVEHPEVRLVPWAEVTGVAEGFRETFERFQADTAGTTDADATVEDRLEQLGYL